MEEVEQSNDSVGNQISSSIKANPIGFAIIATLYVVLIGVLIVLIVFTRKRKRAKRAEKSKDDKKRQNTEVEVSQRTSLRKFTLPEEFKDKITETKPDGAEQNSNNGQPVLDSMSQKTGQITAKSNMEVKKVNSLTSGESGASSANYSSSSVTPSFVTSLEPSMMPKKHFGKSHLDRFKPVKLKSQMSRARPKSGPLRPKSALGLRFSLKQKSRSSAFAGKQDKSAVGSKRSDLASSGSPGVRTIKSQEQLHSSVQSSALKQSSEME